MFFGRPVEACLLGLLSNFPGIRRFREISKSSKWDLEGGRSIMALSDILGQVMSTMGRFDRKVLLSGRHFCPEGIFDRKALLSGNMKVHKVWKKQVH